MALPWSSLCLNEHSSQAGADISPLSSSFSTLPVKTHLPFARCRFINSPRFLFLTLENQEAPQVQFGWSMGWTSLIWNPNSRAQTLTPSGWNCSTGKVYGHIPNRKTQKSEVLLLPSTPDAGYPDAWNQKPTDLVNLMLESVRLLNRSLSMSEERPLGGMDASRRDVDAKRKALTHSMRNSENVVF